MTDSEKCRICGRDREWHETNRTQHGFTLNDGELKNNPVNDKPQRGIPVKKPPFDPILRFVLIEKGIITTEDLESAERKMAVLGVGEAMITCGPTATNAEGASDSQP